MTETSTETARSNEQRVKRTPFSLGWATYTCYRLNEDAIGRTGGDDSAAVDTGHAIDCIAAEIGRGRP